MSRILLLGDISPTKMDLEPSWAIALARRGHQVTYVAECPAQHRTMDGLLEDSAERVYLDVSSTHRHLTARARCVLPLTRRVRPDIIVAFNPVNLLVAHLAARLPGGRPWVHYHAHELFTGCGNVRVEATEQVLLPRSQSWSTPERTRWTITAAKVGDLGEPLLVRNFPHSPPDSGPVWDPSAGAGVVAGDMNRALDQVGIAALGRALGQRRLAELLVCGRDVPPSPHVRPMGRLPFPEFDQILRTASVALSLVPSSSWNQRLSAPYRVGVCASRGVPQVTSDVDYVRPLADAGGAVLVPMDPTVGDLVDAVTEAVENGPRISAAALRFCSEQATMDEDIAALPWA